MNANQLIVMLQQLPESAKVLPIGLEGCDCWDDCHGYSIVQDPTEWHRPADAPPGDRVMLRRSFSSGPACLDDQPIVTGT